MHRVLLQGLLHLVIQLPATRNIQFFFIQNYELRTLNLTCSRFNNNSSNGIQKEIKKIVLVLIRQYFLVDCLNPQKNKRLLEEVSLDLCSIVSKDMLG